MMSIVGNPKVCAWIAAAVVLAETAGFAPGGAAVGAEAVGAPAGTSTAPGGVDARAKHLDTDEPLRKGMMQIRALVEQHHSLVTHRRLSPDMAARFTAELHNITRFIVANSAVTGEARDVIADLAVRMNVGAEAIAGRKPDVDPIDGLVQIDQAMTEYGRRFEHPFWQGDSGK